MEPNRRNFLAVLTGASLAAGACSSPRGESNPTGEEDLARALRELNEAAGLGIAADDFELARDYAVGAYREAALRLRSVVLDGGLDLPVAFAARRGRR